MDGLTFKLLAIAIIFMLGLLGGMIPLFSSKLDRARGFLDYGDVFARGVFLGAGLIHLLPDAENNFSQVILTHEYPYPVAICALTIFVLYMLEELLMHFLGEKKLATKTWIPFLLTILLSVHSLIAGAALGISSTLASFAIIFFAIITHKLAEAFALVIKMLQANLKIKSIWILLIVFSLMTPLGVLFGAKIGSMIQQQSLHLVQGIFDSIAAGTFLYIAFFQPVGREGKDEATAAILKTLIFGFGIATMAIVAIWI